MYALLCNALLACMMMQWGEGTHKSIYMYSTITIALLPLYAQNGDSDFELCLYGFMSVRFMSEEGVYIL